MANYVPYVMSKRVTKEGKTPLYVCYNYSRSRRTLIATGFDINPEHWDSKKKWIKRASPEYDKISLVLTKLTSKLGEILANASDNQIDPTVDYILLELEKNIQYAQRSNRINLFDTLEVYIEEKSPHVSKDQVKDYKTLRKHLTNFKQHSSQPVSFKNLNLKFYNEFMEYLSYKAIKPDGSIGLVINSAGKVIRLLKGFVNFQISKGVIPAIDMKCFKVVQEETDAIYLSEKELAVIYGLDLSYDKELEEIRDIFIVGCFTGLRYSDLSSLNPEHVDLLNECINIKQQKVHRSVIIPMIDYVPDLLKKYSYNLPKYHRNKFNERIKEDGQIAKLNQKIEVVRKKGNARISSVSPKYELISSHTCRRSFCTNMYLSGFPAEELMKISGHTSASAFMRYIKVDNQQSADRLKALRKSL